MDLNGEHVGPAPRQDLDVGHQPRRGARRHRTQPPRIIRNGTFLAFYTVNEFLTPRVAPEFALTCNFP